MVRRRIPWDAPSKPRSRVWPALGPIESQMLESLQMHRLMTIEQLSVSLHWPADLLRIAVSGLVREGLVRQMKRPAGAYGLRAGTKRALQHRRRTPPIPELWFG